VGAFSLKQPYSARSARAGDERKPGAPCESLTRSVTRVASIDPIT
jgi:hypothetical protein